MNRLSFIDDLIEDSLLPTPRIHTIPMPVPGGGQVFLLREDEAGYALAGGKLRKFASLLPAWRKQGIEEVFVIGGSQSNQVLAASQVLTQQQMRFQLFVREGHFQGPGNQFLSRILVPEENWNWIPGADWPQVEALALEKALGHERSVFVLPEGGWCPEALPGVMTLGREFAPLSNEEFPNHIFIDAGTGLSAIGLLFSLSMGLPPDRWPEIHILLAAMTPAEFQERLSEAQSWLGGLGGSLPEAGLPKYQLFQPFTARAFGAVNATLLSAIIRVARTYGLFTDPVYSGKLFLEAERRIEEQGLAGNICVIHSGGQSALPGFYDRLTKFI